MERYSEMGRPLDARFASWLANSSPATIGYYTSCGLSLPDKEAVPHGHGAGWQGRALAAVLRECYRRGLVEPTLEEVEVVVLSVLPEPEQSDDRPRPPFMPSTRERWEKAVCITAAAARTILRYGPASGAAGAETLFAGGTLRVEVGGLTLEQRIDLIWRRPDGALEAVLVFEEPLGNTDPQPVEDDWRCVLAAAVVRALNDENPDIHTVWVYDAAARVARIAEETLEERLDYLRRILEDARDFGGLTGTDEGAFYRLREVGGPRFLPARGQGAPEKAF